MTDALIAGLMQHRQSMLDELYAIHGRGKRLLTDVAAIEGAIKGLGPAERLEAAREIDLARIESKAARTARNALAVLRRATGPLSTREIALEVMRERGFDMADYGMLRVMVARILASLRPQRAEGVVQSSPGADGQLRWEMTV